MDVKTLLAKKKPKMTSMPVVLDSTVLDEYQTVEQRLQAAIAREARLERSGAASMADPDVVGDLTEQRDLLAEKLVESTVVLHLRAISSDEWAELVALPEFEPTEEDQKSNVDVNWKAFTPVALAACCWALTAGDESLDPDDQSWREPSAFTVEQATEFCAALSQGEREQVYLTLAQVNTERRTVPLLRRGSDGTASTAARSNTASHAESHSQSSAAG